MDGISEVAARWGVETEYRDAFGNLRTVEPEVLVRILAALAAGGDGAQRILPRTIVVRSDADQALRLAGSKGEPLRWEILSEGKKVAAGEATSAQLALPALEDGVFGLRVTVARPEGDRSEDACLIVCRHRAYQGRQTGPARMWALAVQLYGVRSRRNWGHGDFTDLFALINLAADLGAAGVGLNPLHALFDDRPSDASPYAPNSRLFFNPLYIDVDAVPEFPGLQAAGLEEEVERLRRQDIVDYEGVTKAKLRALELAYQAFCRQGTAERHRAFDRFRKSGGTTLVRFACFEWLRRKYGHPWWEWPSAWRRAEDEKLAALRRTEAQSIGLYEFVQWLAHDQLDRCRAKAHARALPLGLYLDIAVGVCSDGFDAWCDQDAVLAGMAVGAPPDVLNTAGQNWGLAGFNPAGLEERQFEPFRRMLRASMCYSGAIRLDHVLGLKRLYLIPHGVRAGQGAYVRFPFEAMLAVAALASRENNCIVVGEDLGTIPENFRETLADWGFWTYQVMLFERSGSGAFFPPENYRENALVSFGTHDIATFAGWRDRHDLAVKQAIGLDAGETGEQRHGALEALRQALHQHGLQTEDFTAVARYLADTPSRLLVISMEDVLGLRDQVNLPGTTNEHPNWRRRLPVTLEDLKTQPALASVSDVMRSAGRGFSA
ncbi:MAG TPA: 4-alpha-glucanotransferase [Xanthobacteraceae bacterium]|nr:4-alpha-glucanotransferase [Xanthobacteraceae bacterium]